MLLKSKPRGPFGPLTDFSCQNVFYMPQQMKKSMNKVANKRPSSAPLKSRNARSGSHHRVLPSTPTKKPLELTKVISKYHERCMPSHWIPAPGKTSQAPKEAKKKSAGQRHNSYPLCLVCEYDHQSPEDESIHQLYEKFQKGAVELEQLDQQVKSKARAQKTKVLDTLWKMDLESKKKMAEEVNIRKDKRKSSSKKDTADEETSETEAPSWKEILEDDDQKSKSLLSEKIKQTEAIVNKNQAMSSTSKNLNKEHENKPKVMTQKKLKMTQESETKNQLYYDKSKIVKGSPSAKFRKKKKEKPPKKIVEKEPAKPVGKLMRNAPSTRGPKEPLKPLNDQVQGQTILPLPDQDPDLNSIQESEVDLFESSSTCLDVTLSDTGIKGTNIFPVRNQSSDVDMLQELVDQCNIDNNFGPAINEDFNPGDKNWSDKKADIKREQFKKRYTRETTLESSMDTVLSRDLIKDLVDREIMELNSIAKTENVEKKSKASGDDQDVFTDILLDELKRENRDLKFALVARNQRLEDAAAKVTQLVEQNAYLNQKVEQATMEHNSQMKELIEAQKRYEVKIEELTRKLQRLEEKRMMDKSTLDSSEHDLKATIHNLSDKLKKSEETNKNLSIYIDNLKKSYHTVFAKDGSEKHSSSTPASRSPSISKEL